MFFFTLIFHHSYFCQVFCPLLFTMLVKKAWISCGVGVTHQAHFTYQIAESCKFLLISFHLVVFLLLILQVPASSVFSSFWCDSLFLVVDAIVYWKQIWLVIILCLILRKFVVEIFSAYELVFNILIRLPLFPTQFVAICLIRQLDSDKL